MQPDLSLPRKTNSYREVLSHLKRHIVANRLVAGDKLPTEAVLAGNLNVSRLTVREALKVLESLGVVQSRTRDGTRLCRPTWEPATDHLRFLLDVEGVPMEEIAAARQVLECAMMPMIVANATEADYVRLESAVAAMESANLCGDTAAAIGADRDFHCALLAATNNRAIDNYGVMLQEFFHYLGSKRTESIDHAASIEQHRAICVCLRAGDDRGAADVMRGHLAVYDDATIQE